MTLLRYLEKMKYLKQFSINNTSTFFIENDDIYQFNSDGILSKYKNGNILWSVDSNTQHQLIIVDEFIYAYRDYRRIVKIDKVKGCINETMEIDFFPITLFDKKIYGELNVGAKQDLQELIFIDVNNFNYKQNSIFYQGRIDVVCKDQFFISSSTDCKLNCYKISDGSIKWQLDLKNLLQNNNIYISGDLFVRVNKLFAYITDHRRFSRVVCIDINNGIILRQISNFGGIIYDGGENLYVAYAQKIAWLNTTTFDVHVTSLQGFFVENDWYIEYSKSMVKDGLLYFSASEGRGNLNSHIGVLDLNTFDVLWHTELLINPNKPSSPENRYSVRKILVNDKYLGVQTDGNVLHVFEKFNS